MWPRPLTLPSVSKPMPPRLWARARVPTGPLRLGGTTNDSGFPTRSGLKYAEPFPYGLRRNAEVTTKTLRRRFFSLAGRLPQEPAASLCICPGAGPGKQFSSALARLRSLPLPS